MKRWIRREETSAPDGSKLTLWEHDGDYAIRVNGRELMSTRNHASETRLAELGCAPVRKRKAPRVLIGGLGLGFTLRAALEQLPPDARVVVAELLPPVVAWNRNPDYGLAGPALDDPRTRVEERDVAELILRSPGGFDAILLDADNRTTAMNTPGNTGLYTDEGLHQVHAALRPGGVVAYWSADADPLLAKRMGRCGFTVDVEQTRAHASSGSRHTLLIGRSR